MHSLRLDENVPRRSVPSGRRLTRNWQGCERKTLTFESASTSNGKWSPVVPGIQTTRRNAPNPRAERNRGSAGRSSDLAPGRRRSRRTHLRRTPNRQDIRRSDLRLLQHQGALPQCRYPRIRQPSCSPPSPHCPFQRKRMARVGPLRRHRSPEERHRRGTIAASQNVPKHLARASGEPSRGIVPSHAEIPNQVRPPSRNRSGAHPAPAYRGRHHLQ